MKRKLLTNYDLLALGIIGKICVSVNKTTKPKKIKPEVTTIPDDEFDNILKLLQ